MEDLVSESVCLLDAAKSAHLTSIDRGVATLLLREFVQHDDGEQRCFDRELVKGYPTLLSYNGN